MSNSSITQTVIAVPIVAVTTARALVYCKIADRARAKGDKQKEMKYNRKAGF